MRTALLLLAAALFLDSALFAQRRTLTLDAGFVNASGNSDFTSANFGEKATWGVSGWSFTQSAKMLFGETDGDRTTESYDVGARGERALSGRIGLFAIITYQRDPFAGVASRWGGGPGLAIALVKAARDTLGLETAITAQRERSTAGGRQSFSATRTAASYKHLFSTAAAVTQTLVWVANLETMDDQRLDSETALTAPLSRQIALRVAYVIRFDNLPEPGFESTDRILTTGIQIAL